MMTAGWQRGHKFEPTSRSTRAGTWFIDGTATIAPGAVYSRGSQSVSAAKSLHGTVATVNADGSVRSTAPYELGIYCNASMPLLRQTMRFVEGLNANGGPTLAPGPVECEKTTAPAHVTP
jgi:hypothetical protein